MDGKIRILFYNKDVAGVNYYRTQTPAIQLERDHSDDFFVEINNDLDFNDPKTIEYLKSFHIIHYHRTIIPGSANMLKLKNELSSAGVTLIADIDDYWHLDKTHPFYYASIQNKMYEEIIDNLKIADFVTTTTEEFAKEIRKVTGKDNVSVLPNSVDPTWMRQFKDERKPDPNGLVRITYMAGSSHMNDVSQLEGVVNRLNSDPETKGKFKIIIAGWDTDGTTTENTFNKEFQAALIKEKLWNSKMVKQINSSRGDIDKIDRLPEQIKNEFRGKIFLSKKRPINSNESVCLNYEEILSDKYRIINNDEYLNWLKKYERADYSEDEGSFARRWTKKANIYAEVLNETDISIAPLADTKFNKMKSNLKQVECWSRKIPVVTTDIVPYNVDGIHNENCILIPNKKNSDKYWYRELKKLIIDPKLRERIGNGLYETFKEKYNLKNVTNKRADFYKSAVYATLELD